MQEREQEEERTYTRSGREVRPTVRLGMEQARLSPRNRKRMTEAKRAQKEGRK